MRTISTPHHTPSIEWRNFPVAQVGGDFFGYNWLDMNHFIIYLIDAMGHGPKSFCSAAAINACLYSLYQTNDPRLLHPEKLLSFLNREFLMGANNSSYFTFWYGIYDASKRRLTYASGGAPPAVLMPKGELLSSHGAAIGMLPEARYRAATVKIEAQAKLYIFSDGVYELLKQDGTTGTFSEFLVTLKKEGDLDKLVSHAKTISGSKQFQDDFCLIKVQF